MRLITLTLPLIALLASPVLAQTTDPGGRTTPTQNPFAQGAAPATRPAAPAPAGKTTPAPAQKPAAPAQKPAAVAPAGALFPTAISPKYASEPAGKARQKTCVDQYNANKAAGGAGNAGMTWIEKGGGYGSACNKRLKG
ncbi:hypothetical protein M446_6738 [Methylobacterium sp. 4-46]|uniref:hypothetical protein n=1 Tax=unclassified Methylobacterium TaxID=2615210 RepID=UPI000152D514|nr:MULTISPECIES: hypothetical protein [Methylobacterium]ACA20987.1 hypothetical protein M446_6738 [Methylobacterium sp. 4-46]WFT80141.1 hypothetical protein QA634_34030 [Methylobacterium nodulans]